MYATLTTTRGSNENMRELGAVTGEELYRWLSAIDGFQGLFMLTDESSGTTRLLVLWESEEAAERHRVARTRLREQVTALVGVEVVEVTGYDVAFGRIAGAPGSG